MRRTLLALGLAAASLLGGCSDATGILVEVSSPDLAVGTDVDALQFVARSETGRTINQRYSISGNWPHSLTILPATGMDGELTISVFALHAGSIVTHRVVRASFSSGSTRRVDVVLSAACRGVVCNEGVDCLRGMCVDVPSTDAGPMGVDAGPGFDAGPMGVDAGPMGVDAGPMGVDAGPVRDAGFDAGIDAGFDAGTDAGPPVPPSVFISEYVEGTSNDKAIELFNAGTTAASLSGCELRRYSNGSTSPSPITLSGTIAPGDVYVLCNSSISIATACDQSTASISHNGDDAYDLVCGGTVIDTFGRIGEDPGSEWTGGGLSTVDFVLRRRCTVTMGDADGSDAFDPSVEYTGVTWVDGTTSLTGLGNRSECP